MFFEAEFWVALAFLCFLGILLYMGVPGMLMKGLDKRSAEIKTNLDEARKLKEEAQALLADYQKKRKGADDEANAIIEQAKREAATFASESQASMKDMLERRTRVAEEKIARAEAQAVGEVRAAAIEAAVGASSRLIGAKLNDNAADGLVSRSIAELRTKL